MQDKHWCSCGQSFESDFSLNVHKETSVIGNHVSRGIETVEAQIEEIVVRKLRQCGLIDAAAEDE